MISRRRVAAGRCGPTCVALFAAGSLVTFAACSVTEQQSQIRPEEPAEAPVATTRTDTAATTDDTAVPTDDTTLPADDTTLPTGSALAPSGEPANTNPPETVAVADDTVADSSGRDAGADDNGGQLETSFVDEFDGDVLDERWVVVERFSDISNSEVGCYLRDNVSVQNGHLAIQTLVDPDGCRSIGVDAEYSSGMVQWRSFNYTYGTLEVRARVGGGRGPWPAIWLLGSDCQPNNPIDANHPDCPWPQPGSDEIDVAEFLKGDFRTINNQVHSAEGSPGCKTGIDDASADWHVYTLDWTPDSLTFGVDGETTCVIDDPVLPTSKFLIINTAVGGFGGEIDAGTLPVTMVVDYVRVDAGG